MRGVGEKGFCLEHGLNVQRRKGRTDRLGAAPAKDKNDFGIRAKC